MNILNKDGKNFKEQLVPICKKKEIERFKIFNKYNRIFNKNFNVLNGLDDIYEYYTGAIYFKDYEWESIENNSLKDFFMKCDSQNSLKYSLNLDNGIILRGSNVYYFFVSLVSRFKDNTKDDILRFKKNIDLFYTELEFSLKKFKVESYYDIRLLLGVLDNFRNIILLLENCEMLLNNESKNYILCNYNGKFGDLIRRCHNLINDCCFTRPYIYDSKSIMNLFYDLRKCSNELFDCVFKLDSEYIYIKGFNRLREIDNYFENYITIENALKKSAKNIKGDIDLFVIMYGALELGEIINNNKFIKNNVNVNYIFQDKGNYFIKQEKIKNVNKNIKTKKSKKSNSVLIIDDNIFSGVTMQFAINDLIENGYDNIKGILAIKLVDLNRISQLNHYGNYLDLSLIDKLIFGCTSPTNYTKIKENTNYDDRFVNELYIYSIQSEIFLKAIYINNSFIKGSDVDIFLGFSNGRND